MRAPTTSPSFHATIVDSGAFGYATILRPTTVFVETSLRLPFGERARLVLPDVPPFGDIELPAIVRWSIPDGLGFQLDRLRPRELWAIKRWMKGGVPIRVMRARTTQARPGLERTDGSGEHALAPVPCSSEPLSVLLVLERAGDDALGRGDTTAAILALRRGLDLARRELAATGEPEYDRAIVSFSLKLGDALDRAGETAHADGVLREALALAGPCDRDRPRMLLLLARVAARRGRDADHLLEEALEHCARRRDVLGEARAQLALGYLRLADGDDFAAAGVLQSCIELARDREGGQALVAEASIARAEALLALADRAGAVAELSRALSIAVELSAKPLLAQVASALEAVTAERVERVLHRAPRLAAVA